MARSFAALAGVFFLPALLFCSTSAVAQSMVHDTLEGWQNPDIAETFDHPIIQMGGRSNNLPTDSAVISWDSYGRVRLNANDPNAPFVAYRILTIDAGTDSRYIKSSMDEFDLALGLHLGQIRGWKLSTVLGAGYSSTHPFVHTSGIFGIGHVTAEKQLGPHDSLVLSLDYEGNSGLLPDVPLPGFAFRHESAAIDYTLGFPQSKVVWRPLRPLEITARYTVPYTADVDAEYRIANHFGLYSEVGNFFQGFVVAKDGDITDRQFYQFRNVEAGVRFIFQPLVDGSIGLGYAFDQGFSTGFDVRHLAGYSHLSNEPYLAIVLRGRF